jgi:hypothetical protein
MNNKNPECQHDADYIGGKCPKCALSDCPSPAQPDEFEQEKQALKDAFNNPDIIKALDHDLGIGLKTVLLALRQTAKRERQAGREEGVKKLVMELPHFFESESCPCCSKAYEVAASLTPQTLNRV